MYVQMGHIGSKIHESQLTPVIPAHAGIQKGYSEQDWIPACAGMTNFPHLRIPRRNANWYGVFDVS
jgi:hypothetical protein